MEYLYVTNVLDLCDEILEEEFQDDFDDAREEETEINLLKPKEIKEFLDEYVVGQEGCKKSTFCSSLQSL